MGIAKFGGADSLLGATAVLFTRRTASQVLGQPGTGRRDPGQGRLRGLAGSGRRRTSSSRSRVDKNIEVLTGAQITKESQNDIKAALGFFNTFLLDLRRHRVARRLLHHLQHLLDHRRPAQPGDGPAARDRRQERPGRPLGALRSRARRRSSRPSSGSSAGVLLARAAQGRLLAAFGIDIPASGITIPRTPRSGRSSSGPGHDRRRGVPRDPCVAHPADRRAATGRSRSVRRLVEAHRGRSRRHRARESRWCSPASSVAATTRCRPSGSARSSSSSGSPCSDRRSPARSARCSGGPIRKVKGITGLLAEENAKRNPKRTSATAAALMIGVALVGAHHRLRRFGERASVSAAIDKSMKADYIITTGGFGSRYAAPDARAAAGEDAGSRRRSPGCRAASSRSRATCTNAARGEPDRGRFALRPRGLGRQPPGAAARRAGGVEDHCRRQELEGRPGDPGAVRADGGARASRCRRSTTRPPFRAT